MRGKDASQIIVDDGVQLPAPPVIGRRLTPGRLKVSTCLMAPELFRAAPAPVATCKDQPRPAPVRANAGASSVTAQATDTAARVAQVGGSPAAQLHAAKVQQPNLTYRPHQGARERARRLARQSGEVASL